MNVTDSLTARFNLNEPARIVGSYLDRNSTLYQAILLINHVAKAIMMTAFMAFLQLSPLAVFAVGLAVSVFYRVTIERCCPFKFSIPSCFGGAAIDLAKRPLALLTDRSALNSLASLSACLVGFVPIAIWFVAVGVQTQEEMKDRRKKQKAIPELKTSDACPCG